jgi:16S rRNA (guanine527-N7)-methyltransferase
MGEPVPEAPASARAVFGDRLDVARRYAELLGTGGIERGLLGPREVPRLWERHLVNSAVLTELVTDQDSRLVDVGSGAGLPGLAAAIRRPDLRVDLVESLQRRVDFLNEAVASLGLEGQVRVVRGRAEDPAVRDLVGGAPWVTARAVAPLDRLVGWCLPLLAPGGTFLALKGATAPEEVVAHSGAVRRAGGGAAQVVTVGSERGEPIHVVVIRRETRPSAAGRAGRKGRA